MECIGNWLREGLIIPSSKGGLGLVCDSRLDESDMDVDVDVDVDDLELVATM